MKESNRLIPAKEHVYLDGPVYHYAGRLWNNG